jgi:hypothetical protein
MGSRYDVWYEDTEGEVGVLGSGSDYTSFLHKGMASVRMKNRLVLDSTNFAD